MIRWLSHAPLTRCGMQEFHKTSAVVAQEVIFVTWPAKVRFITAFRFFIYFTTFVDSVMSLILAYFLVQSRSCSKM